MMPTTPSGTRTRSITRPLGRRQLATTAPTGSGSAATSSKPLAIASMRRGSSSRRSRKAALTPLLRAASRSRSLALRMAAVCALTSPAAAASAAALAAALICASARAALRAATPIARMHAPTSVSVSGIGCLDKIFAPLGVDRGLTLSGSAENHVVAMDQRGAPLIAQNGGDLAGLFADDTHRIGPGVGAEAAANLAPAGITDGDGVAALENAIDPRHSGGQQALARQQGFDGAGVDVDHALGFELAGDPTFARGYRI